ncbi:MAG: hypothetical protein J6S67_12280 [Methanobrevibacter sp.]|nr:hypothetical protein [Methanobrevibacter sp.]
MYVIYNYKTHEHMAFNNMTELREFWKHLTINEMGDWSGWKFIEKEQMFH